MLRRRRRTMRISLLSRDPKGKKPLNLKTPSSCREDLKAVEAEMGKTSIPKSP